MTSLPIDPKAWAQYKMLRDRMDSAVPQVTRLRQYWLSLNDAATEDRMATIRKMQQLPELPVPSGKCCMAIQDRDNLCCLVSRGRIDQDNWGVDRYWLDSQGQFKCNRIWLRWLSFETDGIHGAIEAEVASSSEENELFLSSALPVNVSPCGDNGIWAASNYLALRDAQSQGHNTIRYSFFLAAKVLLCLSNIATPCHYEVVVRSRRGFGKPSMRQTTKGQGIVTYVSWDRLHRLAKGHKDYRLVSPHYRRGCLCHRWKDAGVDPANLPASVAAREQVVIDRSVVTYWRRATWVGPRHFGDDGWTYEVVQ